MRRGIILSKRQQRDREFLPFRDELQPVGRVSGHAVGPAGTIRYRLRDNHTRQKKEERCNGEQRHALFRLNTGIRTVRGGNAADAGYRAGCGRRSTACCGTTSQTFTRYARSIGVSYAYISGGSGETPGQPFDTGGRLSILCVRGRLQRREKQEQTEVSGDREDFRHHRCSVLSGEAGDRINGCAKKSPSSNDIGFETFRFNGYIDTGKPEIRIKGMCHGDP